MTRKRAKTRMQLARNITGTLELGTENGPVALEITDGLVEVPNDLVDHVLQGSHGSRVMED